MRIGIDYSLTCPCICFYDPDRIHFRFLTDTKKYQIRHNGAVLSIEGIEHKNWKHPLQRYTNIANQILGEKYPEDQDFFLSAENVNIEDYSMGSKGKVFHIAENTAILKYKIWEMQKSYNTIPPTVVKKFATGKGNAKKEQMYEAWLKRTGFDLKKLFDYEGEKVISPISDIVDSYFLALIDK